MNTKTFSLFAIVAVAAMLSASSIAPAYAAQKVTDERTQTETLHGFIPNPCGDGSVEVIIAQNIFLKQWDNGHFKFHNDAKFNFYDANGVLVGTAPGLSFNIQGNISDLPWSYQFNQGGDGQCIDGTTFSWNPPDHCGGTLQKDGDKIVHSLDCTA